MAGYYPRSLFACVWTEVQLRFVKVTVYLKSVSLQAM